MRSLTTVPGNHRSGSIEVGSSEADVAKLAAGGSRAIPVVDDDSGLRDARRVSQFRRITGLVCQPFYEPAIQCVTSLDLLSLLDLVSARPAAQFS